ncbi:MAG TPA: multicopper oxidase family protein [Vicinamibacterales bacterium]|nr:multicopper oxidase family protein [Vicinamibacterales bacterium]
MRVTRRELVGTVAALAFAGGRRTARARSIPRELVAAEEWVRLAGATARLYAFNQQVPGPLLELQAGDEVQLRLINRLNEPTNLHFHGLHVPPDGSADDVFREVPPGSDGEYRFHIPANHQAGLFWVHPHMHGFVARQVSLGLAAPCIIRGDLDSIPAVAAAREHILVLQDFDLDRSGRPVAPGTAAMMTGREGSLVTVSGQRGPRYAIEQDGFLRLRVLNASASRFYRLALEQHPLHMIATDGGSLAAPETVDDLLLAPGQRADVLVQGARPPGVYRLQSLTYDRGGAGMMRGVTMGATLTLATVAYDRRAEQPMSLPETLVPVEALPAGPVQRTFTLGGVAGTGMGPGMAMRFLINGREFDHMRIDDRVRLGRVEDWEYINDTTMDHPMHVHTNAFQLVEGDGQAEPAWRDVVIVRAGSRARIRTRFDDFAGKTVQHCHILDHEDLGMMSTLLIE